jgi:hypothetical protein
MSPQLIGGIVPLVIIVAVLAMRNSRPRPLRIERLWIRPAIFIAMMGAALTAAAPPLDVFNIGLLVVALLVGGGMGWLRGRSMTIHVHPETHELSARASPLGLILIVGLLVVRFALRGAALESASFLHLSIIAIADAFVLLAVGMMVVQGLEMWLRARRLLAEAIVAKAGPQPPAPPPMPKIIS